MVNISSKKQASEVDDFLQDLANLQPLEPGSSSRLNYNGARCLWRRYRDWFPPEFPKDSAFRREAEKVDAESSGGALRPTLTKREQEEISLSMILSLAGKLREAWDEPTPRTKERAIFELRKLYDRGISQDMSPSPVSFDQAMVHFQEVADRAKHCLNDCLNPYFIAAKRSYKYCRGDQNCAATAQRLAAKRWWGDHGEDWRKRREKKQKGAKHGKR